MKVDRLHKYMGFMMSALGSMDQLMFGATAQKYLIFSL